MDDSASSPDDFDPRPSPVTAELSATVRHVPPAHSATSVSTEFEPTSRTARINVYQRGPVLKPMKKSRHQSTATTSERPVTMLLAM